MAIKNWEYKHICLDIYKRGCPGPDDPKEAVVKTNPFGDAIYCEWWQRELEEILNEYGSSGWEVVSISDKLLSGEDTTGFVLLKRKNIED